MEDVTVTGPVTRDSATSLPAVPTATDALLYGIVLQGVATARLDRVSVSGCGKAGLAAQATGLTWTNGDVGNNLGIGVLLFAGHASLTAVTIHDTLRGFRVKPTFGIFAGSAAEVDTTACTVSGSEAGFGVAQEGGTARHSGLIADHHQFGAVLAQNTTAFTLTGSSEIRDNEFAGVIAVEAGGLMIEDTLAAATASAPVLIEGLGTIHVGDGIEIVRPMLGTMLRGVTVDGNERAGILLDLGGGDTTPVVLADVTSTSTGAAFGCVAQNGTAVAGWDSGLVRVGTSLINDPTFTGGLDTAGIVGPSSMPESSDLAGIVGPSS